MRKKAVMAMALAMVLVFTPMSGRPGAMTAEASNAKMVSNWSEAGDVSVDEEGNGSDEVVPSGQETVDGTEGNEDDSVVDETGQTEGNGEISGADEAGNDSVVDGADEAGDGATTDGDGTIGDDAADDTDSSLTEDGEKKQLATPTGLAWGENWSLTWDAVPEGEGLYRILILKDGKTHVNGLWGYDDLGRLSFRAAPEINESGTYKFRIQAVSMDWDTYISSEWSDYSEEKVYTRPSQALGTTTGYWDSEEAGVFHYAGVEGAGGYSLELFYTLDGSEEEYSAGPRSWLEAGYKDTMDFRVEDFNGLIDTFGAGRYRVKVRALSGNIDEIANGTAGEFSDYFDTNAVSEGVGDKISSAMEAATAAEALATIKAEIQQSELRTAMQTDSSVLDQMKELEERYVAEKGIGKSNPVVSEEAGAYVDAQDISIVGAGLNVDGGDVRLEVSMPEKKEDLSGYRFTDSVQLDISLVHNNAKLHELEVPITVTMPIPSGLAASSLVILHYHEDGTVETVNLKNNGDGTVTFTVVGFSTFIFAVEGNDSPDTDNPGNDGSDTDNPGNDGSDTDNPGNDGSDTDNPGNNGSDTDNPGNDGSDADNPGNDNPDTDNPGNDNSNSNNPANGTGSGTGNTSNDAGRIKDDVPKTGDSMPVAVPITGAVCVASLAVMGMLFTKRRKM